MTKRQAKTFENLLAQMAKINGTTVDDLKAEAELYTTEDYAYEMQSVLNFFEARIQPRLEAKETTVAFDKRYREWRIKVCKGCGEEYAYAYHYDGVGSCSLECLEKALNAIGIKFSRHHDLTRRWGLLHPAVVPATALAALKSLYADSAAESFVDSP